MGVLHVASIYTQVIHTEFSPVDSGFRCTNRAFIHKFSTGCG